MATVPVTAEYNAQKGKVNKFSGGNTLNKLAPIKVQSAVPKTETLKYPNDVAVSDSKQSAGMTARSSRASGKSSLFHFKA